MNIGSTQNNSSWDAFRNLADAARVRNGGFDVPVKRSETVQKPVRKTVSNANRMSKPSVSDTLYRLSNAYSQKENPKPKQILGTKFDFYA